jgi:hypothetical protein
MKLKKSYGTAGAQYSVCGHGRAGTRHRERSELQRAELEEEPRKKMTASPNISDVPRRQELASVFSAVETGTATNR